MTKVSTRLIYNHLKEKPVKQIFKILENDNEIQELLRMSNIMAVSRLGYNDHGPVHAKIASGSSLEIFSILTKHKKPTSLKYGLTMEQAKIIVLCGSYLHDLGNSIHRVDHHIHGCYLANPILDRILSEVYPDETTNVLRMKCEILHSIYAHDEEIECLSLEAGIAKIADGTDMASGRARMPYKANDVSIHGLSALAIRKVEIVEGSNEPVRILVYMDNPSGVFQIEEVMSEKIRTSGIPELVDIVGIYRGKEIKTLR